MIRFKVLKLDCDDAENRKKLIKLLKGIEYFQENEVTTENLEKYAFKKVKKYKITCFMPSVDESMTTFFKERSSDKTHTIFSRTLKEALIKYIVFAKGECEDE